VASFFRTTLYWRHLANTIERSVLGGDAGCHYHCCSNLILLLLLHDREGCNYCDECDCLSARISRKPHGRTSPTFLHTLPVAMAQPSSNGVAMCYALPVLWMTSCFQTMLRHVYFCINSNHFLTDKRYPVQAEGQVCCTLLPNCQCCLLLANKDRCIALFCQCYKEQLPMGYVRRSISHFLISKQITAAQIQRTE